MTTKMKIIVAFVLGVSISTAVAIGTSAYMINKSKTELASVGGFDQPMRMASYNSIAAENTDFTVAAENTVHGVVHITATINASSSDDNSQFVDPFEFFFGNGGTFKRQQAQPRVGSASGVIISTDGYIITNNHVVEGADKLEVTLNDNRSFTAKLIGTDPRTDIALIKIDAKDLPTIPFGDSEKLKVGEWVLAVGNPFNLNSTVTAGIVSAKGRGGIDVTNRNKIESFIQTDAAVNPGNSGGALVNTKGELVGINTAIYSETGNFAGYSFAVPISIAGKVASDLKQYGTVQRAVLGVEIKDPQYLEESEKGKLKVLKGAYVGGFAERSTAKEAGVEKGDVITAVNGKTIASANELQEQISRFRPGDKVQLTVDRFGIKKSFNVVLRNAQGSTAVVKSSGDSGEVLGAAFKSLSEKQMKTLGISYGVEVAGLLNGKMKDAGVRQGFIILIANDQKISKPEQLETLVDKLLKGDADDQILVIKGFYPNGRTKVYAIDLSE